MIDLLHIWNAFIIPKVSNLEKENAYTIEDHH